MYFLLPQDQSENKKHDQLYNIKEVRKYLHEHDILKLSSGWKATFISDDDIFHRTRDHDLVT